MKIVHLEDFIHPDAGYQVNLLSRLQVKHGHEVEIVTGELERIPPFLTEFFGREDIEYRDERFYQETGSRIHRVALLGFYSGRALFRPIRLVRKVLSLEPDVLFVHGEDTVTGMLFIVLSRWLPFPIVLDCHMLEMASKNRFRRYFRLFFRTFITPIILRRNIPFIRVVDSDFVQKCFGIPLERTTLLSLGTDTDLFHPEPRLGAALRKELGFSPEAFVVIYAGKLDEHKGGKFLAQAIKQRLVTEDGRPIEFLIIGNVVGEYGASVEAEFQRSENRISRLPTQRYFDLVKYYQLAHLAVFPKQCSLSFFEVQSCGVPVLFEENEINFTRIGEGNAFTFAPDSIIDFRRKLVSLASMPEAVQSAAAKASRDFVRQHFDFVPISKRYTELLVRTVKEWQQRNTEVVRDQQARGKF